MVEGQFGMLSRLAAELVGAGYGKFEAVPSGSESETYGETMTSDLRPKVTVLLVHGTWGRGFFVRQVNESNPRWFEKGSVFWNDLSEQVRLRNIDAQVESFCWTGENSLMARDIAAKLLAERLVQLSRGDKDRSVVIIAHSHGGNVAAHAISHLNGIDIDPLIVTIATPFVEVFELKRSMLRSLLTAAGFIVVVRAAGVLLFDFFLSHYDAWVNGASTLETVIYTGGGFLVSLAFLRGTLKILEIFGTDLLYGVERLHQLSRLRQLSSLRAYAKKSPATLVLRGVDDEAALSLSLGLVMTRLSRLFSDIITPLMFLGFALSFALRYFQYLYLPANVSRGLSFRSCLGPSYSLENVPPLLVEAAHQYAQQLCLDSFVQLLTIWAPIALGGLLLLVSLGLAAFGRELFFGMLYCEISTASAPDGKGSMHIKTLEHDNKVRSRLRHMLYDNPRCVPTISDWIAKCCVRRDVRQR
jgi:Alpha/beta hydrolase family